MDAVRAKRMAKELAGSAIGGWTVGRLLGNGKSALVFEATRGTENAALKVFDPEVVEKFGEDSQLERIRRETELIGHTQPNLVQILDGGKCDAAQLLFVAMELVRGTVLKDVLGEIPRENIWSLISQLARAALFLEGRGTAHRDIKPENVFINDTYSHATLMDLGVLRPIGDSHVTDTDRDFFIGTHQYASPEFVLRKEADSIDGWRAVSFYQLGGVLHDMLMRRRLFEEHLQPPGRLHMAIQHEVPLVEAADVRQELVALASNCLLKDPSLRLQLVTWTHFDPQPLPTVSPGALRERIRRRQLATTGAAGSESDNGVRTQEYERATVMQRLRGELQSSARREAIRADVLPPIEVHDLPAESGMAMFAIAFRPSEPHGLLGTLLIWVRLKLIEHNPAAVQIDVVGALGPTRAEPIVPTVGWVRLFEGVYQAGLCEQRLQCVMLASFEEALKKTSLDEETTTIPLETLL
jgi:hypothetical protein